MKAMDDTVEVMIYDEIGYWGVTAKQFRNDLKNHKGKQIHVRINSPGGSVMDGIAIYNFLKAQKERVTTFIDAAAFSMASVIALAGKEVHMAENALMMIHKPWAMSIGDSEDMRKQADVLDTMEDALVTSYKSKTGKDESEIKDMLAAETWMTAAEALDHGFIDVIDGYNDEAENAMASFDLSKFDNPPERLSKQEPKEPASAGFLTPKENEKKEVLQTVAAATTTKRKSSMNEEEIKAALEAAKTAGIAETQEVAQARANSFVAAAKLITELHPTIETEINAKALELVTTGGKVEDLHVAAMTIISEKNADVTPTGGVDASAGEDLAMKGKEQALMAKVGLDEFDRSNPYSVQGVSEIAFGMIKGSQTFTDSIDRAGYALSHSTSDFPILLSNIANKSLLKGWDEEEETYENLVAYGSLSDFKTATFVDSGSFPELTSLKENGEYEFATLQERDSTAKLETKGRMISFSRQMLINDDIGAFSDILQKMGRAARRTVGTSVYNVLTDPANYTIGENAQASAAPTTASLDAARQLMRMQKGENGEALNIRPTLGVTPVALSGQFKTVLTSTTEIAANQNNSKKPNISAGMVSHFDDARLDDIDPTMWYLLANPATSDGIKVFTLNGNRSPFLDMMQGFMRDGVTYKVRHDYVAVLQDKRAVYRNG